MARTIGKWLRALSDPCGFLAPKLQPLDAPEVVQLLVLAEEHGVTGSVVPHLYQAFQKAGNEVFVQGSDSRDKIAPLLVEARQHLFKMTGWGLGLRSEAAQVLNRFRSEGIPTMPIKGADFATRLYPNPSLRTFRDVDVLVRREDFKPAEQVLIDAGYTREDKQSGDQSVYGQSGWRAPGSQPWSIEIHWNIINNPSQRRHASVELDDLQSLAGEPNARQASAAALLLVAAVHAAHSHRFDRLQHLCDIRQITRGAAGPIDCKWLASAAKKCSVQACVDAALDVTARLLRSKSAARIRDELGHHASSLRWKILVSPDSLLFPERTTSRVRRLVLRELLKRAA